MSDLERNKRSIRDMVQVVWVSRDLSALPAYWAEGCVNHAAPEAERVGLDAVRAYHESFLTGFLPHLSDYAIEFVQQVAEGDRVVSHMLLRARHTGPLFGHPPTGKTVAMSSMRIDRFETGKIAEHWSVADLAGLMRQLAP